MKLSGTLVLKLPDFNEVTVIIYPVYELQVEFMNIQYE